MVTKKEYYVYGYYDEHGIPFYIGKGVGNRISIHLRNRKYSYFKDIYFYRKLNKMISNGDIFSFKKIKERLSEAEAFLIEEVLISLIGRKSMGKGTLSNLATGGGQCGIADIHFKKVAIYGKISLKLIKTFNSVNECASFLEVHPATISNYYHKKIALKGIKDRYYIDYFKEQPKEFFKEKIIKDLRKTTNHYNYLKIKIIATNIVTNQIFKFNSVKECTIYFNMCKKTIKRVIVNKTLYKKEWSFSYDK